MSCTKKQGNKFFLSALDKLSKRSDCLGDIKQMKNKIIANPIKKRTHYSKLKNSLFNWAVASGYESIANWAIKKAVELNKFNKRVLLKDLEFHTLNLNDYKSDSIEYKLKNRFRTAILEKYLRIYGKNIQEDLSSLHLFTENDSCIDYFFDYIENNFDNPLDKLLEIVTEKRRLNRKNLLCSFAKKYPKKLITHIVNEKIDDTYHYAGDAVEFIDKRSSFRCLSQEEKSLYYIYHIQNMDFPPKTCSI